jgi:hypothetical protein
MDAGPDEIVERSSRVLLAAGAEYVGKQAT